MFTNAGTVRDLDDRKSISESLFSFVGELSHGSLKLQKCVALSMMEAEYTAASEVGNGILWMGRFLQELGLKQDEYVVFCDSAIDLSKNSMYRLV